MWDAEAGDGFREATVDEQSIVESCSLCAQLRALLEATGSAKPGAVHAGKRSLKLLCRRAYSKGWSMIDLSVTRQGSNQEWLLFPTQALSAFRYCNGKLCLKDMDNTFHEVLGDKVCNTNIPDFDSIKGWIESCKSHHGSSCEKKFHSGVDPRRLIDCREKRLCLAVDEPYACLSYVWGAHEVMAPTISGDVLPDVLPQTVSDAMAVTLQIGLRYLWIDRYCIDQSDAEAKHDAILNMDVICKSHPST